MSAHTADHELPRISRDLTDTELIAVLAVQRKGGKYRSSANKIADYVGGDRNSVLAQIREIREGPSPAEFRPITPEQEATVKELHPAR